MPEREKDETSRPADAVRVYYRVDPNTNNLVMSDMLVIHDDSL